MCSIYPIWLPKSLETELRYRYTTITDIGHISLYEFQLVFEIPVQFFLDVY